MEPIIIRPPKSKLVLFFIGMLILIVGLFFMLSDEEESTFEKVKLMVALPAMFLVLYLAYRLLTNTRPSLRLSDAGIELYSSGDPLLLEWSAIERIHYFNKEGVKYTTIKLASYYPLLKQVESIRVKRLTKRTNLTGAAGYVLVIPSLLALEPQELVELSVKIYEMKDVHDFFSLLHYNRTHFGGDFLISWASRNQSAKKFAAYLNKMKESFSSENEGQILKSESDKIISLPFKSI
jgi:hypothetical protein